MRANKVSKPKLKSLPKKGKAGRKDTIAVEKDQHVSLNFNTLRIFAANQAAPVDQIMFNLTDSEQLSFQPTVRLEFRHSISALQNGETLMNKVGKGDSFRAQVIMLFSIATLGLLIGFFIAYFI